VSLFPRLVAEEAAEYGVAGGRVRVLAPEVAHRIAAGEVIERPASAVKELVENALDAGASRVEVDIVDGGISAIRVRDDGHGMSPGDAGRAVAEHATSKIRTADDLARVESLGFRGEALHAIGSVSHLTLTTNSPDVRGPGFRVRVLAGATVETGPASHPPGTSVEARELFLNLPVRRGFLGTVRAEAEPVATTATACAPTGDREGGFYVVQLLRDNNWSLSASVNQASYSSGDHPDSSTNSL
jgi:DNA mismatch repair protein MutL